MCFNETLRNLMMNMFKSNLILQLLFNVFYNEYFKSKVEVQVNENVK